MSGENGKRRERNKEGRFKKAVDLVEGLSVSVNQVVCLCVLVVDECISLSSERE